jgi:hypothetical protein
VSFAAFRRKPRLTNFAPFAAFNPKGIASLSPGLAAPPAYPGSIRQKSINPERVAARKLETNGNNHHPLDLTNANASPFINTWLQPGDQTPRNNKNGFNRFYSLAIFTAAITLTLCPSPSFADPNYTAHEWGTFTSVQGNNGELLQWRPLQSSELPKFIFSTTGHGPNAQAVSKVSMVTLQRMETPVIYFYADQAMNVDVNVAFPKGYITEWYPQTTQIGPFPAMNTNTPSSGLLSQSRAIWQSLEILPKTKNQTARAENLPQDASGSHYFAARETSANLIRANFTSPTTTSETEKFIFYRGTGNFKTPLRVTVDSNSLVTVENNGAQPLAHLFLLNIHDGQGAFGVLDELASSNSVTWLPLNDDSAEHWRHFLLPEFQTEIAGQIQNALIAEGLFPDEAKAMVNTWKDSWFTEEGVRVLYLLPRPWTDEILPLTLTPQPTELTRVMVGRAEMIPEKIEKNLFQLLSKAYNGDADAKVQAVDEFKKLGRFADPTVHLAVAHSTDLKFVNFSYQLLYPPQPTVRPNSTSNVQ